MTLSVFNTMGSRKEPFVPLVPGRIRMYVCGVTVYDLCHIGHARANVAFDIIVRYLRHTGYDVTYIRNFTDIDDKILRRAAEEGSDGGGGPADPGRGAGRVVRAEPLGPAPAGGAHLNVGLL